MAKKSRAARKAAYTRRFTGEAAQKPAPAAAGARSGLISLLGHLAKPLGLDGFTNEAAFIGEASPLISSSTFNRSNLTQQTERLTTMYRESWLAMRIIDMPSEDMTRAWYRAATEMDADDLDLLRRLEARNSIKQEIANAIRWARLYGGSIAVMAIRGQEEYMDQPLDLDDVLPGDFRGLLVIDRAQGVQPSLELVTDLNDPDYSLPMYYDISDDTGTLGTIRVHHSRVLRFIGRELPRLETINENYWGASELEHIYDELQKRNNTSANIAQLVFQANVTTLKMGDFGEAIALGTDEARKNILAAMEIENRFRTSYGLQLLSAGDTMENFQYTFSGLADIYEQFMLDISGAAEIPATKLFGRNPSGLNATGESDLRNYYETISQMQERYLRPALEKLVPVEAMSCWGFIPDDLEIVFEPIAAVTTAERAELMNKLSEPILKAFDIGLLTRGEALAELKAVGVDIGVWDKLPDPEDDPLAAEYSARNESGPHPDDFMNHGYSQNPNDFEDPSGERSDFRDNEEGVLHVDRKPVVTTHVSHETLR